MDMLILTEVIRDVAPRRIAVNPLQVVRVLPAYRGDVGHAVVALAVGDALRVDEEPLEVERRWAHAMAQGA